MSNTIDPYTFSDRSRADVVSTLLYHLSVESGQPGLQGRITEDLTRCGILNTSKKITALGHKWLEDILSTPIPECKTRTISIDGKVFEISKNRCEDLLQEFSI